MATEDKHSIEFALTADDFAGCTDYVFRRDLNRWHGLRIRRIALIFGAGAYAVALVATFATGASLLKWDDLDGIVILLILLLLPYFPGWIARLLFRSAAYAKIRAPRRLEISPAGLRSIDGISDSLTPWSSIINIAVTPAAAYLFILRGSAHILPRHAFADEAAFQDFVAAASQYWRPGGAAAAG